MQPLPEETRAKLGLFEHRYADWLRLRAAMHAMTQEAEPDEARYRALDAEKDDVERLLMTTPAPVSWVLWRKLEVYEQIFVGDDRDSPRGDFAEVWMLAGIKADLLALGVGERLA